MRARILVWDWPTRIFHWSLVLCFALAWLTSESERLQQIHVLTGYLFMALIGFRLLWGVIGSKYARFVQFVRGPAVVLAYVRGLLSRSPVSGVGHNPAGALAIIALLGLGLGVGVSGWMALNEWGGEVFEELHEGLANGMLALVVIHIVAVLISGWLHGESLVKPMFSGYATGPVDAGIKRAHGMVAIALLAGLAVLGWAIIQGKLPVLWEPATVASDPGMNSGRGSTKED